MDPSTIVIFYPPTLAILIMRDNDKVCPNLSSLRSKNNLMKIMQAFRI